MKIGVLQEFVESKGPVENFSSDLFSAENVHRIATLDMRMLNLDRNECNLLVTAEHPYCDPDTCEHRGDSCWRLVPIDHGLSIPDSLAICSYEVAWLGYSQAELPFS